MPINTCIRPGAMASRTLLLIALLCAISHCKSQEYLIYQNQNVTEDRKESVEFVATLNPLATYKPINKQDPNRCVQNSKISQLSDQTELDSDIIPEEMFKYFQDFNSIDKILTEFHSLHGLYSIAELNLFGLYVQSHSTEYSFMDIHHYNSFQDLKQAAGPQVNQAKCIRELTYLNKRLEREASLKSRSRDLRLLQLMDTYGRMPPGYFLGNFLWEGSYRECLSLKIDTEERDSPTSTRYCIAHLKNRAWPEAVNNDVISIQSGVCLPASCDSMNYKNKLKLVGSLLEFNEREVDKKELEVSGLYCLPDERSPMRSVLASPRTLITLVAITCWLLVLAYATVKDYNSKSLETETDSSAEVLRSLSVTRNLRKLFRISTAKAEREQQVKEAEKERAIVDLNIIEGIKVVAMCYVILGHVLMITTGGIIDGRRLCDNTSFTIANMAPAFAVNSFFAITGILTSYLLFKQAGSNILKARTWIGLIVLRYIRIMPLYLFAVAYAKTIAKYTNSGPLWDYATSEESQRRICEQESWLWTLLFAANLKKPLEHCIPGGWYLANDFQFAIITPIFLISLYKYPNFGRKLLLGVAALGYLGCIVSIMRVESLRDMTPIAQFKPHGFKAVLGHLTSSYTMPQYRIPAYLVGLYIGHLLYTFELMAGRASALTKESLKKQPQDLNPKLLESTCSDDEQQAYDWPEVFKTYCVPLCGAAVVICGMVPFIASVIPFNQTWARIAVSLMTPSFHLIFSLATGLFVLSQASATGANRYAIARVLAAPLWKPFARLSLCALLVNVEVIIYIVQGREHLHPLTSQYLWSINLLAVIATYCVSIVVCVLVESPLRVAINYLIARVASDIVQSKRSSGNNSNPLKTEQAKSS